MLLHQVPSQISHCFLPFASHTSAKIVELRDRGCYLVLITSLMCCRGKRIWVLLLVATFCGNFPLFRISLNPFLAFSWLFNFLLQVRLLLLYHVEFCWTFVFHCGLLSYNCRSFFYRKRRVSVYGADCGHHIRPVKMVSRWQWLRRHCVP